MVVLDVPHRFAIVAQLDRAFGSDPEGQRFESSRSHQESPTHFRVPGILFVRSGGFEQQRRRPQPAAETGRSCWGSVLIFQSPAKGLRKNQQTQPVQAPAVRFRQGSPRVGMSTKKDAARPLVWILFCGGGTGREPGQAKAGYHHEGDILPFDILNKAWYTRLSSTNRNLKEC